MKDPLALTAQVIVHAGKEVWCTYDIGQGEHVIGRDPSCEISIETDDVSRRHARLTFHNYEFVIENLSSTNGIWIDNARIELATRIYPGQEVQIGCARLQIKLSEQANRELETALRDNDLGLGSIKEALSAEKYKLGQTIAHGGMGSVLQVRDRRIRRNVAMKLIRPELQFAQENVLRFIDEAQLTGQLEHPNIVPVYELGVDQHGQAFYTMKFVQGVTLDETLRLIKSGDKAACADNPLAHLLIIFQKVCDAIAFAHSKGVVHRDLKPENIMIGGFGEVLVLDWGLAKAHATRPRTVQDASAHSLPESDGSKFKTLDGIVIGTPPYIAPEQARGEIGSIDTRTDIYALGTILYSILTLRPPVKLKPVDEMLREIIAGEIVSPIQLGGHRTGSQQQPGFPHCPGGRIPESLSAVTMKAMRVDPAQRYQRVAELQKDIESYQGGFATTAERAGAAKQLILLIKRRRTEFALLTTGFLILTAFGISFLLGVNKEKNRALASEQRALDSERKTEATLTELRGVAPTFAAEAKALIEQQNFQEALTKISYAISQVGTVPEYHVLRGNILQSLLRVDQAARAYDTALQRNPNDKMARANLDLCGKLLQETGGSNDFTSAQLREMQIAMRSQNRFAEAVALMNLIEKDRALSYDTWREIFQKRGLRGKLQVDEDGMLLVELAKNSSGDLAELRGMPIRSLNADGVPVSDLTPLQKLPLKFLSLGRTKVVDLAPLRGMQLDRLSLNETRVADLRPLEGMPLRQLSLYGCGELKDLSPLHDMALETLNLSRTPIREIKALAGTPVRDLNLEECRELYDVKPLMECQRLEALVLPQQCRAIDFLRKHPALQRISFNRTPKSAAEFWKEFDTPKTP